MKQSIVLPSITINYSDHDGNKFNSIFKCYAGDYILLENGETTHHCSVSGKITLISQKDAEIINFDKLTNYHKSYRDGKLKNIKYFL